MKKGVANAGGTREGGGDRTLPAMQTAPFFGAEHVVFGGRDARKLVRRGSFCLALQEVNEEPSMVIWRRFGSRGAFVLCLSSLHKWFADSNSGRPSRYALDQLANHLPAILGYMPTDRAAVFEVMDLIYRYAADLVKLAPDAEQRRRREAMPKQLEYVELAVDGKTINRIENKH